MPRPSSERETLSHGIGGFVRWLLSCRIDGAGDPPDDLRAHYSRIAASIDPVELQRSDADAGELTEEDVLDELTGAGRAQRILGYYSMHGVEYAFSRYGILDRIRRRGFSDLEVSGDPGDPSRQVLRIHGDKGEGEEPGRHLLVELVVRRRSVPPPVGWDLDEAVRLLWVEWLLLQDPTAEFTAARPPLPGQEHPGLGVSRPITELLVQACRRLELDGLGNCPAHYHNAAGAPSEVRFLDPIAQGRFEALREVLTGLGLGLGDASHSVLDGKVRRADGTPVLWEPTTFVLPTGDRLAGWLASESYAGLRDEARAEGRALGLHLV